MRIVLLRIILPIFVVAVALSVTQPVQSATKRPLERRVNAMGVRGHIALKQISSDAVEVTFKTSHGSVSDTVIGKGIPPLFVNGKKEPFYFGRFGSSLYPMLVFVVGNPDRIQDSWVLAYQLSSNGALIGQQVVVDQAIQHAHTDEVSGGRYELMAVDTKLGAIYSIAYQDARFEGYTVTFEKLRIRQWEPAIESFVETDQGFLRDRRGRIVESIHFDQLPDAQKEQVFLENLLAPKPVEPKREQKPHLIPASAKTKL